MCVRWFNKKLLSNICPHERRRLVLGLAAKIWIWFEYFSLIIFFSIMRYIRVYKDALKRNRYNN